MVVAEAILLTAGGIAAYRDWKNKKYAGKHDSRGAKFFEKYHDLLEDPSIWNKWGTSKKRKFAADERRASKYGASPFKFKSGRRSGIVHEMDSNVEKIEKKQKTERQAEEAENKKSGSSSKHGGSSSKNVAGGQHIQLSTVTPDQQSVLDKATKRYIKTLEKGGLSKTEAGKQALKFAKDIKNPNYKAPSGVDKLLNAPVGFEPYKVKDYGNILSKESLKKLQDPEIRDFNEQILPEIKAAFAGNTSSGAYQRTINQAKDSLEEKLARIEAEYEAKGRELGLQKSALDISGQNVGIGKINANANLRSLGLEGQRIANQQGQFDEGMNLSKLGQALGMSQQDIANVNALLPYILGPRQENLWVPKQGNALFGGGASYANVRRPQETNYLGQVVAPVAGGLGAAAGTQLGKQWFV